MTAALVLAGVCGWMPAFGVGLPDCSLANQLVECRCSECLEWDPTGEVVREYQVYRDGDGVVGVHVGTLAEVTVEDEVGAQVGRSNPPTVWCVGRDEVMPHEGVVYAYRVRACDERGCSPSSLSINYKGAPYAVDEFRPPEVDNP